jgi:hypothetical protein
VVVAFDGSKSWMQVTERVAQDGWVTASPEFIVCEGPSGGIARARAACGRCVARAHRSPASPHTRTYCGRTASCDRCSCYTASCDRRSC